MLRTMLPIALVVGVAFAPVYARAESQLSLKSVSVDLPPGDGMFPNGPGADAVNNNCLACHSADMVLNQPAMSKVRWQAEVDKMRTAYKAPIDPKDVDAILDYLVSVKGEK
jgi:mono/diheme cytochrome c family protein